MRILRYNRSTKGLTLVEMLVVLGIYSILLVAIGTGISAFYSFNAYTIAQAYQVYHARTGMQSVVRDIREMTYADDGAFPLEVMTASRVGFYSDIDRDASVEYVEYVLNGTVLNKYVYNATGTTAVVYNTSTPDETYILSEYVQNEGQGIPMFTYYDGTGSLATASSTVTDIRYVQAEIIVNIDPIRDPGEFKLVSSAALRNLLEN